jgi:cell surface protein SprA
MLDPANFTANYSYNETFRRDVNTEFQMRREHRGGLSYNFSHSPHQFKPFGKIGFLKDLAFMKWLTDFNFYLGIKQFTASTTMDRQYESSRVRNNTAALLGVETNLLINTQVVKTWQWNRQYALKYDLTQAIKFDFTAGAQALVGEPAGVIDRSDDIGYQAYRDSVLQNLRNAGEVTSYNHNVTASYTLPFSKLPLVNFINSDVRYQGTYRWDRAPFSQDSLGNTIQNSRNLSLNLAGNMTTLYNKVPFLQEALNAKPPKREQRRSNTSDRDGCGNEEEDKEKLPINPVQAILRTLMAVRNFSGSISRNEGMLVPGYAPRARWAGMDDNLQAPGLLFLTRLLSYWRSMVGEAVNCLMPR